MNQKELLALIGQALVEAGKEGQDQFYLGAKNDPTSLTPVGPYAHGPTGLFSVAGQDARVFSAVLTPTGGLIDNLPVLNGADDSDGAYGMLNAEYFTTITGITQGALMTPTNQPTTDCADGPRAGLMKVCTLVSTFGRYRASPNAPVSIFRSGVRRDLADPTTLRLMNGMGMGGFGVPDNVASERNVINNEISKRIVEQGRDLRLLLSREIWTGNPTLNSGERRFITGLQIQVNQNNKVDQYTSNVCTAMNSYLRDFQYQLITGTGNDIVRFIDMMYAYLYHKASRQGMLPVRWVIVMREEAFDEIVKVWPIRYYQEALTQISIASWSAAGRVLINANDATEMRDDMRNNSFLPIRGVRVTVIRDDGIPEFVSGNGGWTSDIFFIPISVLGDEPVTYWKYYNHENEQAQSIVNRFGLTSTFTSDGGMFRWYVNFKNGCLDWTTDFAPRLIMRTPQLAGRLLNVRYQPLDHFSSAYPDEASFQDGGRTTGPLEDNLYTEWSISTPVNVNAGP